MSEEAGRQPTFVGKIFIKPQTLNTPGLGLMVIPFREIEL
jgi:hypothetical protein